MTIRENLVVRTPAFLSLFYFVVDVVIGPVIFAPTVLAVKKCSWQPTKFRHQISTLIGAKIAVNRFYHYFLYILFLLLVLVSVGLFSLFPFCELYT